MGSEEGGAGEDGVAKVSTVGPEKLSTEKPIIPESVDASNELIAETAPSATSPSALIVAVTATLAEASANEMSSGSTPGRMEAKLILYL